MTAETTKIDTDILQKAANEARGLAIDAVSACSSGHLGLPLGAAEIGAVLFSNSLQFNPEDPDWINRDRFILSAGHGSMFLYSWLHLAGYDLSLQDLKDFRKMGSKTPGHPESLDTPGVECTTGPLGQGIGNAVGMAVAAKMAEATFNTPDCELFNHHIIALCGDGCLQEGVSAEAVSFAGRQGLDNLIIIYDSNDVTLDAAADKTQCEDTSARFQAYGFDVCTIDGHNMCEFFDAFNTAKANKNNKPKIIIAKTLIGKGIPEVEGTSKAHGESGAKFSDTARAGLGLPSDLFHVSQDTYEYFKNCKTRKQEAYNAWQEKYKTWKSENPEKATVLEDAVCYKVDSNWLNGIPEFDPESKLATRAAGEKVLNALAAQVPLLVSGSADLHGSTKNYIKDGGDFDIDCRNGRNIYFGIREHAMAAIVNGFGYYGLYRASGATFLTFADYMRPSIRLAALSHLPIFHIFTHDSIGVGEDGPTHQPVEHVSALRAIPNLDVIRPGDPEETAAAFYAALERTDGPTALCLSRQSMPTQSQIPVETRRQGTLRGGYIAKKETGNLETIILATGSELQHALNASEKLGNGVRVVSMPCCERFERQDETYKNDTLPPSCTKRVAIEAGISDYWYKYVGTTGKIIGVDRFGISAPGDEVMQKLGITTDAVVEAAKSL